MVEGKTESLVRGFTDALVKGDVDSVLSFVTEDAVLVFPCGSTYRGKDEWRDFWKGMLSAVSVKFVDSGVGLVVKGNTAIWERVMQGATSDGKKCEVGQVCVHECVGDKIRSVRMFHDRLLMAKQMANGWLQKRVVGAVVNGFEKSLS